MNRQISDVEPELNSPPPRDVRERMRSRLGRWFLVLLGVVAPAALAVCAWVSQRNRDALRDHGVAIVGRVVDLQPADTGDDGHGPRAAYEYRVDGVARRFWEDVREAEYAKLRRNDEKQIVYLPEAPRTAATADELERGGRWSAWALALWSTGGILATVTLPIWIWTRRKCRRLEHLAREGLPVRTTTLELAPYFGALETNYWRARYQFDVDGRTFRGSATIDAAAASGLENGAPATVLYDPSDPRRFELYRAVLMSYEVCGSEANRIR